MLVGAPAAIWLAANVLYGWQVGQFPAVIDVLTIYGPPAVVVVLLLASAVDWASTGREPWDGNLETWTPLRWALVYLVFIFLVESGTLAGWIRLLRGSQ